MTFFGSVFSFLFDQLYLDVFRIVTLSFLTALFLVWFYLPYWKFKTLGIPTKFPFPIIGDALSLFVSKPADQRNHIKKYGKTSIRFIGRKPVLYLAELDDIKAVCIQEFSNITQRQSADGFDFFKSSIVDCEYDRWKNQRRILSAAFTGQKLREGTPLVLDCCKTLVKNLGTNISSGPNVDISKYMGAFTLDAIGASQFGVNIDALNNPDNVLFKHAQALMFPSTLDTIFFIFSMISGRIIRLLRCFRIVTPLESAVDYFRQFVDEYVCPGKFAGLNLHSLMKSRTVDEKNVDPDILHEDAIGKWVEKGLTNKEVVDNSAMFIVAAYGTTSGMLSFLFYELALNPELQDDIRKEILSVCPEESTYDGVGQMNLLEQCVLETLRKYPLVLLNSRVTRGPMKLFGKTFPSAMDIIFPVYAIHHDPEIWSNPEKFDPSRFEKSVRPRSNDARFMPFGLGPRNCIGSRLAIYEAQVVTAELLRQFRFSVCAETMIPITFKSSFTLEPKTPIIIGVHPISEE